MSPFIVFKTAVLSLGANKLRAGLTLLGIVIGVAAVISLMAIGQGAQRAITANIEALGTNLLFVRPQFSQSGAGTLTLDDAYALLDPVFAPDVAAVAPELTTSGQIVVGRENTFASIMGVTPEYERLRNYGVHFGQFISPTHVQARSEVAVLGSQVAETLFGARDPTGQMVRVNGRQFAVIGVLESKGGTALGLQDNQVLVPITTAYYRLTAQRTTQGGVNVQTINVQVREGGNRDDAQEQISVLLRLRHRITTTDDFTVTSQQDTIETLQATTNTFVIFLAAIASISLLVGGIGIMNIMLVSVTERTREIGIRKALGAKRFDILSQFVTEATLLSLGGGVVGILVGMGLATLLNGRSLGSQSFQTTFSGDIALLAMAVSAGIGLFFGIYPAMRASRLHPIEALRYQ